MRIAMFGHKTVPSRDGGVEIVVEELATRMVEQGNEVTLFNRQRKGNPFSKEYKGIKLINVKTIDKKNLDAIVYSYNATKKLVKMCKKGEFDVVHVHAEGPCAFLKKFPKKLKRNYKLVVTIHGLDWQRGKWGGFANKFLKHCEKQAAKYADEVIVLSKNNIEYFKETYNRETIFIPNGVNLPVIKEASLIIKKYNLTKDDYVLFLARIVPEKGLDYLVEAWKQMSDDEKNNKKLVIAGGSSHTNDYYQSIIDKCKDDNSIILTGFIKGQELEEIFSNAYLYVLPSDVEGMPMSLLEAKSYGNICLVSSIPENVEIIDSNDYCFEKSNVTELKQQLVKIINLNITTHLKQVQVYNWDDVVKSTLDIYQKGE